MSTNLSQKAFEHAKHFFPGGVNSPVRSFGHVGGVPPFIARAKGSKIWDVDGNEYIDYVGTWGPAIVGHAHPAVLAALTEAMQNGTSFGAPSEKETELATLVQAAFPSMQMLRFVNSGTEATMSALRLARGFTKKKYIIKFDGCYHGHADSLLVKAGSGAATHGEPTSAGVLPEAAHFTLVAPFNDLATVAQILHTHRNNVAAIIVEPVAGNMGCVPPQAGFLAGLRKLCSEHSTVLIFDEVMTGFRVSLPAQQDGGSAFGGGGAQHYYNVEPDLTCLGKIIGGGLPVGAYGGKKEIMQCISPLGPVYQAGTLSGNPLAMAAGIATLKLIQEKNFYEKLNTTTSQLTEGLRKCFIDAQIPAYITQVASMWSIFFNEKPVHNFAEVQTSDTARFKRFFHFMLEHGIYLAPSPFEAGFVSSAHTKEEIAFTLEQVKKWTQDERTKK